MGLIYIYYFYFVHCSTSSLFDVTSAQQVPFGIPQYVQCIFHGLLPVSPFVSHLPLLTAKSVDLAKACDGFPSHNGNHP